MITNTTPSRDRLECADLRHAWMKVGDNVFIGGGARVRHFRRQMQCSRCGTVRSDEFEITYARGGHVSGALLKRRSYSYPQDYQVKGGLKVGDARIMLFDSLVFVEDDST